MCIVGSRLGSGLGVALIALIISSAPSYADRTESTGHGAWIGISVRSSMDAARERAGSWTEGAEVVRVEPGSPAETAGLEVGDVILSIGSRGVKTGADLAEVESGLEPGRTVSVAFTRDRGRVIKITNVEPVAPPGETSSEGAPIADPAPPVPGPGIGPLRLASGNPAETKPQAPEAKPQAAEPQATKTEPAPAEAAAPQTTKKEPAPVEAAAPADRPALGVRGEDLSPDLAAALGMPGRQGVLVLNVLEGSPAERAGIHAGDVIVRVGESETGNMDALRQAVEPATSRLGIQLVRHGSEQTVTANFGPETPEPAVEVEEKLDPSDSEWRDRLLLQLREELRELRGEIQRLRDALAELKVL